MSECGADAYEYESYSSFHYKIMIHIKNMIPWIHGSAARAAAEAAAGAAASPATVCTLSCRY